MFNCEDCGQTVPPRIPATLVTVAVRPRHYPGHEHWYPPLVKCQDELYRRPNAKARRELWRDAPAGHGQEIVRQLRLCPSCAARQNPIALIDNDI